MKILIACEESQTVLAEIKKLHPNWDVYSCDLLPCSGAYPSLHLQQDVTDLLKQKWDMIIAFPPCTYLTVTGNRWFNIERYGDKARQRHEDRKKAIDFFMMFANADCDKIVIENPIGIMSTHYKKPSQIVNPYEFGEPYEKKTCLWIKGLPNLIPTNVVEPLPRVKFKSGKTMAKWYSDAWKLPKQERAKIRSKTFVGMAKAMADQWTK